MVALAFKNHREVPANDVDARDIVAINGAPKAEIHTEREEIAAYLTQMTGELAVLARSAQYDLLAYFLEMARIEAKGHTSTFKAPN
jgi:hypothetical protein